MLLSVREVQIKCTVHCHYTHIRMTKIKRTDDPMCQEGCGASGSFIRDL